MMPTLGIMLTLSFIASLCALGVLIWATVNKQFSFGKNDGASIFMDGEEGKPDDGSSFGEEGAAHSHKYDVARAGIDQAGRKPVMLLTVASIVWLVIGSTFGLIASLKLHLPDWLADIAFTTFGRARTIHLNIVAYGWLSVAGLAVMMWLLPRIFHTPLRKPQLAYAGAILWTIGVFAGALAIATGWSEGIEWLEFPWQIDLILAAGGFCMAWSAIETAAHRKTHHIYVTAWYFLAGLLWFPILFTLGNIPGLHSGVQQATMNWWFAHNVLGLWLTPLGLGTAYYLIPKIIGKPIFSYSVSLLGFWGLALFYSQVGIHHLMGGPVPTWVVTLSVIHSVMMFVPVIAAGVNHHITVAQNLWAFKESMALRFVWTGAIMYTLASFQGSIEALRAVNTITHFTHYTVGHAHLGAYAFVSLVLFGAFYYMLPHILQKEWPCKKLITLHYWLVLIGFGIYFFALSIAGVLQGIAFLDIGKSFAEITKMTIPYLEARSVGGGMMTLGHFIFAIHIGMLLLSKKTAAHKGEH